MVNGCGTLFPAKTGANAPGINVAEAALKSGSGEVALQVTEGILRENPQNIAALEIRADALTLLGQYDEAAAIYQGLLAKDPDLTRATIGLGRIKLASDPAAAEVLFQRVLKQDPKDLTALNNLGIARDLQGRHAEAQTVYRGALALSPDQASTQVNLALSLAMSGHGPEAIELMRGKAAEPGAPAKIKHDYAVVLAMSGHREDAEKILRETMSQEEVRQALDSVTESRTKTARALAPDRSEQSRVAQADVNQGTMGRRGGRMGRDDGTPPDVVQQIPEARQVAPAQVGPTLTAPAPMAPPAVIHPRMTAEPDTSLTQSASATRETAPMVTAAPMMPLPETQATAEPPPPPANTRVAVPAPVELPPLVPPSVVAAANRPPPPAEVHEVRRDLAWETPPPAARIIPRDSGLRDSGPRDSGLRDSNAALVQFTAAPSEAAAHAAWASLAHRFPDVLGQRAPIVIRVERGGQVFWRVRAAGFESDASARAVCSRMRASGQDCFVPRS